MRTLSRLAVLALVALALPATASAADPWSLPAPIRAQTTTPPLPGAPGLAANAHGMAIAVAATGASVFADGAFSDPARLTPAGVAMGPGDGRVLPYGQTRIIGAGIRAAGSSSQAVVAFGRIAPSGASLDSPRGLGPSTMHAARATMAVNAKGDAAIVFPVCRDAACTKVLVYLAMRAAGTSTFRSTRLADGSGPLPQVAAAINARGDAMAVWTQASTLYARIRTAGGTVRPRQRVGPAIRGPHLAPSAVLSLHRAQLVGWLAQAVSEGDGSAGTAPGRAGARRRHVHDDRARHDPGARRRRLRVGGRRTRRLRLPGARGRRVDGLRGRALPGPPGRDPRGGEQPVAEPHGRRDAVAGRDRHGPVRPRRRPIGPDLRAHARRRPRQRPGHARRRGVRARERRRGGRSRRGRRGAAVGVAATLLSDGRVLAAWTTVGQGDLWSVRASPTR